MLFIFTLTKLLSTTQHPNKENDIQKRKKHNKKLNREMKRGEIVLIRNNKETIKELRKTQIKQL